MHCYKIHEVPHICHGSNTNGMTEPRVNRCVCSRMCLCLRPCVFLEDKIILIKCAWNMVLIWLPAHLRQAHPFPPLAHLPSAFLGPFCPTERDVGVRGVGVCTGRVWDRLHNQQRIMLSNYFTMEVWSGEGGKPSEKFNYRVALFVQHDVRSVDWRGHCCTD